VVFDGTGKEVGRLYDERARQHLRSAMTGGEYRPGCRTASWSACARRSRDGRGSWASTMPARRCGLVGHQRRHYLDLLCAGLCRPPTSEWPVAV